MKGSYILIIRLNEDRRIRIGSLGEIDFKKGYYCYVGSAYGPGGIEARVKRHLRTEKKMRWHIDYLLKHAEIEKVMVKEGGDEIETGRELSKIYPSIEGFGASDSPLKSHLFHCKNPDMEFIRSLGYLPFP